MSSRYDEIECHNHVSGGGVLYLPMIACGEGKGEKSTLPV